MTPKTNAPNTDAPDDSDNDATCSWSLYNHKNKKNNMTTNTDAHIDDALDAYDGGDDSPESLILDSSLKCKIEPNSMSKLISYNWKQLMLPLPPTIPPPMQ